MSALRRKAVESAARLPARRTLHTSSPRRSEHPHSSTHSDSHHSHDSHHHGPVNESLGPQFYIALAAIPISIGVYAAAQPGKDGSPALTKRITAAYNAYKETWAARNTLHTTMLEQAAFDRNLYQSDSGSAHLELRFPEVFSTGSPHNVIAGHQARNMDQVFAHYEKQNREEQEKILKRLEERKALALEERKS